MEELIVVLKGIKLMLLALCLVISLSGIGITLAMLGLKKR